MIQCIVYSRRIARCPSNDDLVFTGGGEAWNYSVQRLTIIVFCVIVALACADTSFYSVLDGNIIKKTCHGQNELSLHSPRLGVAYFWVWIFSKCLRCILFN